MNFHLTNGGNCFELLCPCVHIRLLIVVEDQLKVFVYEESSVAKHNALNQNHSTENLLEIVKKICEVKLGPR